MLGSSSFPHWRYLIVISVGSASVPYRWSQPWKPFFFLSAHLRLVWKRQNWLVWSMLLVAKQHLFKMNELTCGGLSKCTAFTSVSSNPFMLTTFHFPSLLGTPLLTAWVIIFVPVGLSSLYCWSHPNLYSPIHFASSLKVQIYFATITHVGGTRPNWRKVLDAGIVDLGGKHW